MKKLKEINTALPGLLIGIVLWGILCQLVGIILSPITDKGNYSIGLWVGVLTALMMSFHMAFTLNHVVEKDIKGAQATATVQNLIRYFIVVIILGILMVTKTGNPIAAFVGIMGLKVSAYIQPLLAKLLSNHKDVKTE